MSAPAPSSGRSPKWRTGWVSMSPPKGRKPRGRSRHCAMPAAETIQGYHFGRPVSVAELPLAILQGVAAAARLDLGAPVARLRRQPPPAPARLIRRGLRPPRPNLHKAPWVRPWVRPWDRPYPETVGHGYCWSIAGKKRNQSGPSPRSPVEQSNQQEHTNDEDQISKHVWEMIEDIHICMFITWDGARQRRPPDGRHAAAGRETPSTSSPTPMPRRMARSEQFPDRDAGIRRPVEERLCLAHRHGNPVQ